MIRYYDEGLAHQDRWLWLRQWDSVANLPSAESGLCGGEYGSLVLVSAFWNTDYLKLEVWALSQRPTSRAPSPWSTDKDALRVKWPVLGPTGNVAFPSLRRTPARRFLGCYRTSPNHMEVGCLLEAEGLTSSCQQHDPLCSFRVLGLLNVFVPW